MMHKMNNSGLELCQLCKICMQRCILKWVPVLDPRLQWGCVQLPQTAQRFAQVMLTNSPSSFPLTICWALNAARDESGVDDIPIIGNTKLLTCKLPTTNLTFGIDTFSETFWVQLLSSDQTHLYSGGKSAKAYQTKHGYNIDSRGNRFGVCSSLTDNGETMLSGNLLNEMPLI